MNRGWTSPEGIGRTTCLIATSSNGNEKDIGAITRPGFAHLEHLDNAFRAMEDAQKTVVEEILY